MTQRGFSLPELLTAVGLFSILAIMTLLLMTRGMEHWRHRSGGQTVALSLSSASRRLEADLGLAGASTINLANGPASLAGGAADGQALWFLSAIDPLTGEFAHDLDGNPFWQRNILYYLVVPQRHQQLYGYDCQGGSAGLDDFCPHKILLRKVIDSGVPTDPTTDPEASQEQILTDITPYLTRPDGLDISAMNGEAGLESVEVVATRLLYFEVTRTGSEVVVDLRASSTPNLERSLRVGSVSLRSRPETSQYRRSFFPAN
ncbi:MAG: type II secretion system protein J [Vulcanimicrobiota bacterium]